MSNKQGRSNYVPKNTVTKFRNIMYEQIFHIYEQNVKKIYLLQAYICYTVINL